MGNEQQGFQIPTTRSDDRSQSAPKSIFGQDPGFHGDTNPEPSYKKQLSGLTGYKFGVNDQRNYGAYAEDRRQFAIASSGGVDLAPPSAFVPSDVSPKGWVFGSSAREQSEGRGEVAGNTTGPVSTYKTYEETLQRGEFGSTRVPAYEPKSELRVFDSSSPGINNLGLLGARGGVERVEVATGSSRVVASDVASPGIRRDTPPSVIFGTGNDAVPMKPGSYAQARGQATVIDGAGVNAGSVKRSIFGENNYRGGYEAVGSSRSKSVAVTEGYVASDRSGLNAYAQPSPRNRVAYEGGNAPVARGDAAVIFGDRKYSGISDTFARNNFPSERSVQPQNIAYMDKNEFRNQVEEGRVKISANFKQEDAEILATRANPTLQSNYRPSPSDYKFAEAPLVSSSALKYVPDAYNGVSVRSNLIGSERSQLNPKQISSSNFYEGALGRGQVRVNAALPPTSEGYEAPEYIKSNRIFDDNTKTSRIYLKDASIRHLEAEVNAQRPYVEKNQVVEELGKVPSKVSGDEFEGFLETNRRAAGGQGQPLEFQKGPSDFQFIGNSPVIPSNDFYSVAKAVSPTLPLSQNAIQTTETQTLGRNSVVRAAGHVVASELEIPSGANNLLLSQQNLAGSQIHGNRKTYLPIETGDYEHAKFASAIKQDRFKAREGISAEKLKVNSNRINLASQEGGLGINLKDIKPAPFSQPSGVAILTNKQSNQAIGYVGEPTISGPMTINRTVVASTDVSHGNNPAFQAAPNSGLAQQNSLRSFQVDPFGHPPPISFPNISSATPNSNFQGLAAPTGIDNYSQGISNPSRFKIESQGMAAAQSVQPVAPNMNSEYPGSVTSSLKIGELGGDFGAKIDRTYATYNPVPISPIISPATANPSQAKVNTEGLGSNYNVDAGLRRQNTNEIIANMKPVVYQADLKSPGLSPNISPINQLNFQNDFTPRDAEVATQIPSPNRVPVRTDSNSGMNLTVTPVPSNPRASDNLKNGMAYGSSYAQAPLVQTSGAPTQVKSVHYLDTVNIAPVVTSSQTSPGILQAIKDKIMGPANDVKSSDVQGQASVRNGYGTVSVPGQYTYEGLFVNGMFHGSGNMKYPDGTSFVGEFKNNRKEGHGRLYAASGQILREGLWVNDQPI